MLPAAGVPDRWPLARPGRTGSLGHSRPLFSSFLKIFGLNPRKALPRAPRWALLGLILTRQLSLGSCQPALSFYSRFCFLLVLGVHCNLGFLLVKSVRAPGLRSPARPLRLCQALQSWDFPNKAGKRRDVPFEIHLGSPGVGSWGAWLWWDTGELKLSRPFKESVAQKRMMNDSCFRKEPEWVSW